MKYLLILMSILLTACSTTLPKLSVDECLNERRSIENQQRQLKLRKEVVLAQLDGVTPLDGRHLFMPKTALVDNFNREVALLELAIRRFNLQCTKQKAP